MSDCATSPARDVERLPPAADPEHGQAAGVGLLGERELEGVEVGLDLAEQVVRRRAVGVWVEVGSPGEAEVVEAVQQRADRVVVQRRQDDRQAARSIART
jgi:hypothetical protein